ncbi:MAG: ABC transporter permease [Bacteroidetes bacterium]|nr:ABC transporter permease [Bacteroidota bacterium]
MNLFFHLGRYFILIKRVFSKPEKLSVYVRQIIHEIDNIGISSLPIIAIISFFMGGVITIQSAFGFTSPLVPLYAVGYTAGGYVMGIATGACSSYEYIFGIQAFFEPWKLYYSFTKVITFAFLITSISSYFGYYTHGGALEVGKSSTAAVVYSSILILIFNFLLTQLFLT